MNYPVKISVIAILLSGLTIYFPSCKKEMEDPIKNETKGAIPPIVLTFGVSSVTQTTVSVQGSVLNDGGAEVFVRGVCWSTSENPTIADNIISEGAGIGSFISNLADLMPDTQYYVRAYATNSAGISYGKQISFKTNQFIPTSTLPTLATTDISSITASSAVSGGNIADDGGGEITHRGICWSTIPDAYIYSDDVTIIPGGSGTGSFISYLSGLNPGTTYYVRAYAVNSAGIAFGSEISFVTANAEELSQIIFNPGLTYGSVTDIDGNIYKTIQIGTQVWMAENLKTTKYNNGVPIQNVTDFAEWSGLITGAYCWYNNDAAANKAVYGALYNWFTVNTGILCPVGWHVPSDAEWITLIGSAGGKDIAGGNLKETGNSHWLVPNMGATNATGFTAVPGGTRNLFVDPDFNDWSWINMEANWWSSSQGSYNTAIYWGVFYNSNAADSQSLLFEQSGFSVRCIKD